MPYRIIPFHNDRLYHVFNRSIAKCAILTESRNMLRFLNLTDFYRFSDPPNRFSVFNRLSPESQADFADTLRKTHAPLTDILAFSLMPNHIHFVLRQRLENGIPLFMKKIQDAFAKYFDRKTDRTGSVFQVQFKGIRIESPQALADVVRYVHRNPVTAHILNAPEDLIDYPWTSFTHMQAVNSPILSWKRKQSFPNTHPSTRSNSIRSPRNPSPESFRRYL